MYNCNFLEHENSKIEKPEKVTCSSKIKRRLRANWLTLRRL